VEDVCLQQPVIRIAPDFIMWRGVARQQMIICDGVMISVHSFRRAEVHRKLRRTLCVHIKSSET
jgi:hypothetical protein